MTNVSSVNLTALLDNVDSVVISVITNGTFFFGCMLIVTVIFGNVLIVFIFLRDPKLHVLTNYWIISLAATDLLLGIGIMPIAITTLATSNVWLFGSIFCEIFISLDVLCCTCSIYHLVLISLDRYFCVRFPLQYPQKRTKNGIMTAIACLWSWCIVVSLARLLGWSEIHNNPELCLMTHQTYMIFSSVISFYLPLVVIITTYTAMYRTTQLRVRLMSKKYFSKKVNEIKGGVRRLSRSLSKRASQRARHDNQTTFKSPTKSDGLNVDVDGACPDETIQLKPSPRYLTPYYNVDDADQDAGDINIVDDEIVANVVVPAICTDVGATLDEVTTAISSNNQQLMLKIDPKSLRTNGGGSGGFCSGRQTATTDLGSSIPAITINADNLLDPAMTMQTGSNDVDDATKSLNDSNCSNNCTKTTTAVEMNAVCGTTHTTTTASVVVVQDRDNDPAMATPLTVETDALYSEHSIPVPQRIAVPNSRVSGPSSRQAKPQLHLEDEDFFAASKHIHKRRYARVDTEPASLVLPMLPKGRESHRRESLPIFRTAKKKYCQHQLKGLQALANKSGGGAFPQNFFRKLSGVDLDRNGGGGRESAAEDKLRKTSRLERNRQKQERRAGKVIIVVITGFVACWAPFFIVNVLDPLCRLCVSRQVWNFVTWLGYANSAINPFIYTAFNRTFRTAIRNLIRCRKDEGTDSSRRPSGVAYGGR